MDRLIQAFFLSIAIAILGAAIKMILAAVAFIVTYYVATDIIGNWPDSARVLTRSFATWPSRCA